MKSHNNLGTTSTEVKKGHCPICGEKIHKSSQVQLSDGVICVKCGRICNHSLLATVKDVENAWNIVHSRWYNFDAKIKVSNLGSGTIMIDTVQQCAYLSNGKKGFDPVVFAFSEVESYEIQTVGQKTVTRKKGGVGRAVVGGVLFGGVGAVVGAATAKEETKIEGGISLLNVNLNINGLKTTIPLYNPPLKAVETLESILNA